MPFTLRSLFMKNIVPGICEYWCPETNSLHTLKGKVSNSLLDIHGFLGLLLSGFLYDEVVRPSKELKTALERSCNDLFIAFHILRQRFDLKPTIEEWIAFWFCGPVKYHTPMTSGPRSRTYDFGDNVSSNLRMPNFSGFGRAKAFDLDGALELISSGRGFCWNSAIRHQIKETLINNGQLSWVDFAYFASIRSSYVYYRCEDSFVIEHYCPHRLVIRRVECFELRIKTIVYAIICNKEYETFLHLDGDKLIDSQDDTSPF
ncbi:hypothetical protein Cgig2_030213 [Carnegiea gigantea]|uniref:Uncharacterized protein n=1 Tax=Carnegiea gigantea TaxID=171969 RepID=A0A9Q1Q6Z3_9CARY|nr:hypothetical protein Cgig2_030213 [Carnegiea gigantea]